MPKLEGYASYIKTIFQQDDSIAENSETEPLPATITESEGIIAHFFEEKAPILNNEEVVSTASKLGEDNIVDEPPIEQPI